MLKIDLNGTWKFRNTKESDWIEGKVPGSVCHDLLVAGRSEDPFYRDNEDKIREVSRFDFEYKRSFNVDAGLLDFDKVFLHCCGLDTLAEIRINEKTVGRTDNMHRTYEFDIKDVLVTGENSIHIRFSSPINFIEKKQKEFPLWGSKETIDGFPHIRKAHYMLGWDWGPQLPDMGIWRDISILGYKKGRLKDIYFEQLHGKDSVLLETKALVEKFDSVNSTDGTNHSMENCRVIVYITSPDGDTFTQETDCSNHAYYANKEFKITTRIDNPELWWPNGYGNQPLYSVKVALYHDNYVLDEKDFRIGLRELKIVRNKDKWGESFEFNINGISIFVMGANYIPEDNLLARCSRQRTEKLIKDCVKANFNCLRVWGGGIYPDDYFYDLCDEYGLLVWQDFLFACAAYNMTDEFAENIRKEAEDNIRRLRHHASLALWCGNNELEVAWANWDIYKDPKLKTDYVKQFEILLRQVVEENDPQRLYWPSSPSSGGCFEDPEAADRGDVHYWDVWHGQKPITEYRKTAFRFVSEFGFQSFPESRTIESFTLPEDRNVYSRIMEKHQKNLTTNSRIMYHMSELFQLPKDFDSILYASQVLQAEAIKCAVEHWRRDRGRCMGALYWQLNDCWPAVSWSGIDYFGRWKALHYYAVRFFAPVLLSVLDNDKNAELFITNETRERVSGRIEWKLRDHMSRILRSGSREFEAASLTSVKVCEEDFTKDIPDGETARKVYLEYSLHNMGTFLNLRNSETVLNMGTVLFVKPKHFEFLDPDIQAEVTEEPDKYLISLTAKAYARSVQLALKDTDCVFSDNYIDLSAKETRVIALEKDRISGSPDLEEIRRQLLTRSVFDIADNSALQCNWE